MAVSLVNANGDPISTFGSGNTAYAQGDKTNAFEATANPFEFAQDKSAPGTLLSPKTFGSLGVGVNTGQATATTAGNTLGMGYSSLSDVKAPRGTGRGGGGGGRSSPRAPAQLVPNQDMGIPAAKPGTAPEKPDGPSEDEQADMSTRDAEQQMNMPTPWRDGSRNAAAAQGSAEGRPGGDVPGGNPPMDEGDFS